MPTMDRTPDVLSAAPTTLSVQDYAEARAKELLAMSKAAVTVKGNNQPLQKLPRHIRRRAASHNVKRLPRTLHSWAKREMLKAGPPSKHKRPSRKYRRRPSNLLQEYRRRQRKFVWLETHIWHAKRFHMTERWGYKIPLHPNDKGARAAYRATAKYCLLQDLSYYCCVELQGMEDDIIKVLGRLSSPELGLTFAARVYRTGKREGRTVLYRHDEYPFGALGEVKFMWKYRGVSLDHDQAEPPSTQLWIWTHPAMYQDFMSELRFVLGEGTNTEVPTENSGGKSDKQEQGITEENMDSTDIEKDQHSDKPTCLRQETFSGNNVTCTSLKDKLCRFHLTGPLANEVLLDTLKVASVESKGNDLRTECDVVEQSNNKYWWKSAFEKSERCGQVNAENHRKQGAFWESVNGTESPGELEPNCILGLTVRDPRVLLPPMKKMVRFYNKDGNRTHSDMSKLPDDVSYSHLWDTEVRQNVKDMKWADRRINEKRSEALVPGSEVHLGDDESRIPVFLIQNPGRRPSIADHFQASGAKSLHRPGYGSGWDLVLPGGWGVNFLVALVYRGARVAGLKEIVTLAVEEGMATYPNNYPDTPAGKEWERTMWQAKQSKYDRVPPAKRCSYAKMGAVSPFHFPWTALLKDWDSSVEVKNDSEDIIYPKEGSNFYVLRCRKHLRNLQGFITRQCTYKNRHCTPQPKRQKTAHSNIAHLVEDVPSNARCLVPVQISLVLRGAPTQFAMICLPSKDDIDKFRMDQKWGGFKECIHKTPKVKKTKPKTVVKEYGAPPSIDSVRTVCDREVIGYVKEGSFSFASGHGLGLGFVVLLALPKLLEVTEGGKAVVLLRCPTSLQYRTAYLQISAS